jgi:hypothetical protein
MVENATTARVYTWIDANRNGIVHKEKKPLPDVNIIYPTGSVNVTNNSGLVNTYDFKAGFACKC